MEIGILSMQRVVNYGSFLQAYALKETLTGLGHECFFIDIKPGTRILNKPVIKNENILSFIVSRMDRHFINRIKHYFFTKKRSFRFNNEFFPVLGLSKELNYISDYDVVVIGSDEVFNCTQQAKWGFAKTLFGEQLDAGFVISYAASCGHTTLEKLTQYGLRDEVRNAMLHLKAISVRDKNTKEFASKLTGKEVYEHIDPTLIYDFGELVPASVPEKDYILIYAYDGRINDKQMIAHIRDFANQEKKKIICAGVYQSWCDEQILCTPFELLAYFKNADYVLTDTFHGTVFSIKYNKKFGTIIRDTNKEKLYDLLERFGLLSRQVEIPSELTQIMKATINYQIVNKIIDDQKNSAIQYLLGCLEHKRN